MSEHVLKLDQGGTSVASLAALKALLGIMQIQCVSSASSTVLETDATNCFFQSAVTSSYLFWTDGTATVLYRWSGSALTTKTVGGTNCKGMYTRPGGTIMIGTGTAGTAFRRSTDNGDNWSTVNSTESAALAWQWACGAENGSSTTWIAFGCTGAATKVQRSTDDGATVAAISYTTNLTCRGAAANATTGSTAEWLLIFSTGATKKSTDNAATFSSGNSLPNSDLPISLKFVNGYFCVLCASSNIKAMYYTSSVGSAWSTCNLPVNSNQVGLSIDYYDGKYWLLDSAGNIWSTTDITATYVQWIKECVFNSHNWTNSIISKGMLKFNSNYYFVNGGKFYKFF